MIKYRIDVKSAITGEYEVYWRSLCHYLHEAEDALAYCERKGYSARIVKITMQEETISEV